MYVHMYLSTYVRVQNICDAPLCTATPSAFCGSLLYTFTYTVTCLYHTGDEYAPRMEKQVTFTKFGFERLKNFVT